MIKSYCDLKVSQGSLKESETQLILANRLDYLESAEVETVLCEADEVGRMLSGLINRLEQ
jgi:four helix bundle protein